MRLKLLAALTLIFCSTLAHAEWQYYPDGEKWKAECGVCHIPFPPDRLAKKNWQQLMANLEKHFGVNASLDENEAKEILVFLERHSKNGSRQIADSMRMTDTIWYKGEHREIPLTVWKHPAVKSPANCTVCHINAEKGDWSQNSIRLPGVVGGRYGEPERQ